jgi:hypothetical protein
MLPNFRKIEDRGIAADDGVPRRARVSVSGRR